MIFHEKKVLVLGSGETGISMVKWLSYLGAHLSLADSRANPPNQNFLDDFIPHQKRFSGHFDLKLLENIDAIAISPGVPLAEAFVQEAIKRNIPVFGDIELFALALNQLNQPKPIILAITGSNGKTTVTSMVGDMVKAAGWDVEVAGNIGPAVLKVLLQRLSTRKLPQCWVLELSSFQLETTQTLFADSAVVLNISEDHFDRYDDLDDYAAAKARIFISGTHSTQILNRDDPNVLAMALPDKKQVTFGLSKPSRDVDFGLLEFGSALWLVEGKRRLLKADMLKIPGMHNVANALAALALCRSVGLPHEPLVDALLKFRGLPHRMQKIATIQGVDYYDDSKSTNVGSAIAALNGMKGNIVLIAGGDGKGQDFSPLIEPIKQYVRALVLLGRDAEKISQAIKGAAKPIHHVSTMEDAVRLSFLLAKPNDMVLLSPACASLDMFRNYIHRAEVFTAAVKELESKGISLVESSPSL